MFAQCLLVGCLVGIGSPASASNTYIRALTNLDSEQVKYVMHKFNQDSLAESEGRGASVRWRYVARR